MGGLTTGSRDLLASLALHALVVLAIGFWTPSLRDATMSDQSLPIEVITIDEFTKLLEESTRPKEAQPEETDPVVLEQSPAPAALQPDAMPALQDENRPPPDADALSDKPIPDTPQFKVAKPVPLARPERKPRPILDLGQVRALLNKAPVRPNAEAWGAAAQRQARIEQLTINEVDAFRSQMRRCWSPPSGAKQAENLVVRVRVSLTPQGLISAGPKVVNRELLRDPYFRAAAESVLRAIRRCQPFKMPVAKYASWRNIELTFDPSQMLGG